MQPLTDKVYIELPFGDLSSRTVVSCDECYLELFDTHLKYKNVAEYIDKDEVAGNVLKSNYRWTRLKSALADVAMYYSDKESKWCVSLEFNGTADNVGWYWESPKDALKVYTQLSNYLIKAI